MALNGLALICHQRGSCVKSLYDLYGATIK